MTTSTVTVRNFNSAFVEQINQNFASIDAALTNVQTNVASLADLKALSATSGVVVSQYRSTAGDGGGGVWAWRSGNQSTNVTSDSRSGLWAAPDSDTTGASGAWQRIYSGDVNARWFGAVGDGTTDNYAILNSASAAIVAQGGGVLYLPPAGAAYKITNTVALGNGVKLKGAGTIVYPGDTATNAQWTAQGTWINPTHTSNTAVKLNGHGSAIEGINFIHTQTAPSGSFTPTTYGWCIEVIATLASVENIRIINASHGIWWHYTTGSGGGTNCRMRDVIISAFSTRLKTTCVNDSMYWQNIRLRGLWYESDSNVVAYIRANTIGWDCGYTDNLLADGIEFFEDRGITFTDETCLSITHSLYNATLTNIIFNLTQRSMQVASTSTTVRATWSNVVAQQGDAFGTTYSDTIFALASDNVTMTFESMTILDAGGIVLTLGNGTGGRVHIGHLIVNNYSRILAGQVAFSAGAGATIAVGSIGRFVKTGGSGAKWSGSGTYQLPVSTDVNENLTVVGTLQLGSTYAAGAPAATGYVTLKDSTGTTYKVLVST